MNPDDLAETFEEISMELRLAEERCDFTRVDILLGALERVRVELEGELLRPTAAPLAN